MASIQSQAEASAPGSMILMGEYAVLEGARAVLMALKHRLAVRLEKAEKLKIISDRFGEYTEDGADAPHAVLCRNVIGDEKLNITIASGIPPTYGFASSAALVAALVKALFRLHGRPENLTDMFALGHAAILETYGRGSGADLAAALADRPFIVFDPVAKTAEPFAMPFGVQAIYTGYKTPTPEVLRRIEQEVPRDKWQNLTREMKGCVDRFIAAPSADLIREYQTYMDALGVTCGKCKAALDIFTAQGAAAKISGSGRGDCVVGLSQKPVAANVDAPFIFFSAKDLQC